MKTLTPGHLYELKNFETEKISIGNAEVSTHPLQRVQFIEKIPNVQAAELKLIDGFAPGTENELHTVNNGTTNEEVLEMLIDRMQFLQSKFPCRENAITITKLEEALMWQNKRTADRVKRNVEGQHKA